MRGIEHDVTRLLSCRRTERTGGETQTEIVFSIIGTKNFHFFHEEIEKAFAPNHSGRCKLNGCDRCLRMQVDTQPVLLVCTNERPSKCYLVIITQIVGWSVRCLYVIVLDIDLLQVVNLAARVHPTHFFVQFPFEGIVFLAGLDTIGTVEREGCQAVRALFQVKQRLRLIVQNHHERLVRLQLSLLHCHRRALQLVGLIAHHLGIFSLRLGKPGVVHLEIEGQVLVSNRRQTHMYPHCIARNLKVCRSSGLGIEGLHRILRIVKIVVDISHRLVVVVLRRIERRTDFRLTLAGGQGQGQQ